jgi:uncharacterized repeat protein (TIGR01451 family)
MRRATSAGLCLSAFTAAAMIWSCTENPAEPAGSQGQRAHIPLALATASTASGATLATDKDDYAPGDMLRLAGWGWQPGDTLDIHLDQDPQNHPPVDWLVEVDADGRFWDSTYVVQESDLGVTFALTATSRATGETTTAVFFDFNLADAFINSVSSTTPPTNSSFTITAGASRTTGGGNTTNPTWAGTSYAFNTTNTAPSSGSFQCLSPAKPNPLVTVTATASPGTTGGSMTIPTTGLARGTQYLFIKAEANTTCNGSASNVSAGQLLTITGPDLTILKTHTGNFTRGSTGSYTIHVSNVGEVATSGLVTVSDVLPSQFTFSSVTATNWSCTTPAVGVNGTVSCTRSDALAPSLAYDDIVLVVSVAASGGNNSPTNTATVSNASDAGAGNNSADDPTTLNDAPATQLVFTTSAFNIAAGACSPAISVQSRNATDQPTNPSTAVTVNLTSTSAGGTFYSNAGCTTLISSVTIPTNSNHTPDFYYKDTQGGTPTLTAADAASNLTSATQQETITQAATGTTVTANKTSPQEFGTSVTFTAAVKRTSDNSAVTVGSVTFYDGGTCAVPGTQLQAATAVNGSGQVPFTTTTLSVAAHTILACYGGTLAFTSSSGTLAFTISLAATGTTVTANKTSPQDAGTSITFTATVKRSSDASAVTAGSVTFYDGGNCGTPGPQLQAAAAVNGSGQVPFTTTTLSAAAHTILACYGGTTEFATSSGTLAFTITDVATTTTVTANKTSPQEFGISITFTAAVKRSSDNSAATAGSVTFYDGGSCGSPGTELQAATAVNGSGQVAFTTATLSIDDHTILACYGGSAGFAASSGTLAFTITTVATTTEVTADKTSPQEFGTSITFTASVKRASDNSAVTTGSVTFYEGGSCGTPGPQLQAGALVNASGAVTFTTSTLSIADHIILACYGGTTVFKASGDQMAFTITKIATSTTVTANKTSPQEYGTSITFTASVKRSSGNSVVTDGQVAIYDGGTCDIPGTELKAATDVNGSGQVSVTTSALDLGTHTILACYGGTEIYKTSSGTMSMQITAVTTSATVTVTPSSQQYSDKVELKAAITPYDVESQHLTGTVYFYVGSSAVTCGMSAPAGSVGNDGIADADDGVGTYTYTIEKAAGSYTVTACFYSSSDYFKSSNNTGSLTVTKEDATLEFTNLPGSVLYTSNISFTVRVRESYANGVEPNPNPNNSLVAYGDISKIGTLSASLAGIINNSTVNITCNSFVAGGSGYSSYRDFTCTNGPLAVDAYTVTVSVPGTNYYYTGSVDDAFNVYDPAAGFVTGGGTFSFGGNRVSFGLSFTYSNGAKSNLRGGMVVVRHLTGGGVCRIKSNSMNAPSVVNTTASMTGKGNYNCVDAYGNTTASAGNLSILTYVEDVATSGAGADVFFVGAGSSAPMLNMGSTPSGNTTTLTGGNIQVPQPGKK